MSLLTSASIVLAVPVPHAPAALRGTALDAARTAVVSSRTSGWTLNAYECPAGQRNAEASECKAAVQEAAQSAGLEVRGFIKNVDVGSEAGVPPGCSYSHASKGAIFNVNATGRSNGWYQGKSNDHYPWVCLNEGVQTDVQQSMGGGLRDCPTRHGILSSWLEDGGTATRIRWGFLIAMHPACIIIRSTEITVGPTMR